MGKVRDKHSRKKLGSSLVKSYCKGLSISSLCVSECSFYVAYKWVLLDVSMIHGKFVRKLIFCVKIESSLQ